MITIFGYKINSKVMLSSGLIFVLSVLDYIQSNLTNLKTIVPQSVYDHAVFWVPLLMMVLRYWFPSAEPVEKVTKTITTPADDGASQ